MGGSTLDVPQLSSSQTLPVIELSPARPHSRSSPILYCTTAEILNCFPGTILPIIVLPLFHKINAKQRQFDTVQSTTPPGRLLISVISAEPEVSFTARVVDGTVVD